VRKIIVPEWGAEQGNAARVTWFFSHVQRVWNNEVLRSQCNAPARARFQSAWPDDVLRSLAFGSAGVGGVLRDAVR